MTYAEKIDPAERRLDPSRPAVELERVVRALTPGIGAYVELEGGERPRLEERASWTRRSRRAGSRRRPAAGGLRRAARSSCSRCSRRRARDGRPPYLRGHRPARRLAGWRADGAACHVVVRRVFEQGAYADRAFRAEAERLDLLGRDRAFAMSLAYGVVQRRRTLDHVIASLRPPAGADRLRPCWRRSGSASTSCSSWTASPTTLRSPSPSTSPSRPPAAATGS